MAPYFLRFIVKREREETMGEIRELMLGNYNDKFVLMTENQKGNEFYRKARALSEDLIFLKMLVRRNSTSGFGFEVIPQQSVMDFRFWNELFMRSYGGHTEEDYVRKMLSDYYLAKNMFEFLMGEHIDSEQKWTNDVCKAVKVYFQSMHDIKIEDYIGCFIDCSHTCHEIENLLNDL